MNGTNIKLRNTILNAKIIIYACFVLVWCLSWKIGFFYFQKICHFTFRVFIQKKGWADILLPIHSMSTVIGSAFSKSSAASRCSVAFSTVPWFMYSCLFFLVLWIRSRNAISTDWPWGCKQDMTGQALLWWSGIKTNNSYWLRSSSLCSPKGVTPMLAI